MCTPVPGAETWLAPGQGFPTSNLAGLAVAKSLGRAHPRLCISLLGSKPPGISAQLLYIWKSSKGWFGIPLLCGISLYPKPSPPLSWIICFQWHCFLIFLKKFVILIVSQKNKYFICFILLEQILWVDDSSIIFIAVAMFFYAGNLRMHIPSWANICGPLRSTPFSPSAFRPGELGHWISFNYSHVLCVSTLHWSRQRWDAFIVVSSLSDTSLSLRDLKKNPQWRNSHIGHSTKTDASRMGPESSSGLWQPPWALMLWEGWAGPLQAASPSYLISRFQSSRLWGCEEVHTVVTSTVFRGCTWAQRLVLPFASCVILSKLLPLPGPQ